eukprot:11819020-Heterocapsa_arctica.AAC.1
MPRSAGPPKRIEQEDRYLVARVVAEVEEQEEDEVHHRTSSSGLTDVQQGQSGLRVQAEAIKIV